MQSTAMKRIPKKKILESDDEDVPIPSTTVASNVPDLNKSSRSEKPSASSSSSIPKYSSSNNPITQPKSVVQQAASNKFIIDVHSASKSSETKAASKASPINIHPLPVDKRINKKIVTSTGPRKAGAPDWIKVMTKSVLNNEVTVLNCSFFRFSHVFPKYCRFCKKLVDCQ